MTVNFTSKAHLERDNKLVIFYVRRSNERSGGGKWESKKRTEIDHTERT